MKATSVSTGIIRQCCRLFVASLLLGLAACSDNSDSVTIEDGTVVETTEEPVTDDQLSVKVTADLSTAVLRPFEEGSTGAALVNRLPVVTSEFNSDTRMVLLPGSMFDGASDMTTGEINALVQLGMDGGYIALERPTSQQFLNFAVLYAAKLVELQQLQYQELFDLNETAAARAAMSSQLTQRTKARLSNIEKIARRHAADTDLNAVRTELLIIGPTDNFMQQPLEAEVTIYASETDSEGNASETVANTVTLERTAARSGQLADAAAQWLNEVLSQQRVPRRAARRADDTADQLETTETFTYNGMVYFCDWQNTTQSRSDRLTIKVSSRIVHDSESNKDFYHMQQDVLLSLADKEDCPQVYYTGSERSWMKASGDGAYNRWFGAFLSQYQTSMNLTGSDAISLESSAPTTTGDSQLQLSHHTDGNCVTWTYDGTLPKLYVNKVYCHELPASVQVSDIDLKHEACWSVSNATGRCTVEVTSAPKLTALLFQSNGSRTPPQKYVDRSDSQTYTYQLAEPVRAIQTWRMSITNVEYDENLEQHGTVDDLENALKAEFPDYYVPEFQLLDHDATSLSSITSVITESKRAFGQKSRHLDEIAKRFGMKKFEIVWSREGSEQVKTSRAVVYCVCPKATDATVAHLGWVYGSDGYLYPSADYAKGWDAKAVGILVYLNDGSDFGDKATEKASGAGHGLVLALWDPSEAYLLINGDIVFPNPIGSSMENTKNDFDGLAKTKWLAEHGSRAVKNISRLGATPSGCTDWFIPSTGQWIAMLCTPGLGGAEIPSDNYFNTPFNINGATKLSRAVQANRGMILMDKVWTSSAYSATDIIWLVNDKDNLYFQTSSAWRTLTYVRPVFAF